MYIRKLILGFSAMVVLMALLPISASANGEDTIDQQCNITTPVGRTWLATGTVTRVEGPVFYLLGKDNVIYKIDSQSSEVLVGESQIDHYVPKVGETVRVYGTVGDECKIDAARVRIFSDKSEPGTSGAGPAPEKEIKIVVRQEPSSQTSQPSPPAAAAVVEPVTWEGRGLITSVDYVGRRISIQTSTGNYTINLCNAPLIHGAKRIGLGILNQGDAVRISGNLAGLHEVNAQLVRVTRTRSEAENAVPLTPISIGGVIQQVDYPSFTFKMATETTDIVVSVDPDTVIQQNMAMMAFMDLKPGMRIKMSGTGSLATGYAAQHIQIISVAP